MIEFTSRLRRLASAGVVAVGAVAIFATALVGTLSAPARAASIDRITALREAPLITSKGWQANGTYSFPTGTTSIFLHMSCPASFPIVMSGAFALNGTGQTSDVSLGFNGPRIDETTPTYNEWGWHFYWPNGSPAGVTGVFSVFCVKTAPL